MIGYSQDAVGLQAWAQTRSDVARAEFVETGSLVTLGYSLAMADIAQFVVGPLAGMSQQQLAFAARPKLGIAKDGLVERRAA